MKFVQRDLGDSAESSSGGGGRGLLHETVILLSAMAALAVLTYFGTGWVTELLLPAISVQREKAWFGGFAPDDVLERDLPEQLTTRQARAAEVLRRLGAHSSVPPLDYRLFVMRGEGPNAFAFPGGAVGVTTGLLELLDDDTAMAFVLGHELGHFAQRDHLRGIGRQIGRTVAWALITGDAGGDALGTHLATLLNLSHSRAQEEGADRFGLRLVHQVYGTTEGTGRLFAWLEERDRTPAWTAMFATHPRPQDRLASLRAYARELEGR